MKITVINSSPRKKGVTSSLLHSLTNGFNDAGAIFEVYNLYEMNIKYCDGCFQCWYKHQGTCKFHDSFNEIYNTMIQSDLIVIASPIYGMMINGMLKSFLDRVSMVSHLPDFIIDEHSKKMVKPMYDYLPPIAILMVGNMSGREIFDAATLFFTEYFRITNAELRVIMLRHQSELLIRPILEDVKSKVFGAMRQAGFELVKEGIVKPNTLKQIEQDLLEIDKFIEGHNMFWKICTRKKIAPMNVEFDKYPFLKI